MKKGKIIILNGVSSSGKTTLAKVIQDRSPIPLYKLDIDDFILMAPEKYNDYENGDFSVQYAFASKFFHVVKLYSDLGFDLIVPYMFFKNSDTLQEFRSLSKEYPVMVVNVTCPVEELQRRELARKNRKIGRVNKRKHELYDLKVNHEEAIVVKIIFDKYTTEGYGAHRITTWLNDNGYRARTGKMWHEATIRGILCNLTYTGVLRSGEARSEVILELQIITPEQFERARMIMQERSDRKKENTTVPLNTKGKSLISGKVYCGHCGSRLNLTTSGRYRKRKDGSVDTTKRIRYACYGKSRKQTECDGQSGYTLHILDDLIDEIVRDIFRKMKGVSKNDVIKLRYADELELRKARLSMLKTDYSKEIENLAILKSEVIKAIKGESSFSADTLSELIAESEKECNRLFNLCTDAEREVADGESVLKTLSDRFDELISWAELYDEASFEKKKMIVNCLIKRVEVFRGYKLKVEFNIDFGQFMVGIDKVA